MQTENHSTHYSSRTPFSAAPMQRVLFLKASPGFPIHGADISVFERMQLLRDYGWDGVFISTGRIELCESFKKVLGKLGLDYQFDAERSILRFRYLGTECRMYLGADTDHFTSKSPEDAFRCFDAAIEEFDAKAVMGNVRDPFVLDYLTEHCALPHVFFLTENEFPKKGDAHSDWFSRSLSKVRQLAVASEFLRDSLDREYGKRPECLTNSVLTSRYATEPESEQGEYITMTHPYIHKGVEVFLQLAERLPERKFMMLAGTGPEYRQLKNKFLSFPNIKLVSYTTEMATIYRQSRLVIVPSIWEEGFSRVIIEALSSGVPVIASGRGGTRQTGGDAAKYASIQGVPGTPDAIGLRRIVLDPWVQAIESFDDPLVYREYQQRGARRIAEFNQSLNNSMARLAEMLQDGA